MRSKQTDRESLRTEGDDAWNRSSVNALASWSSNPPQGDNPGIFVLESDSKFSRE